MPRGSRPKVTFGLHEAKKFGLGRPITFLPMSVKIELAIEATKHTNIVLAAGMIHAGICKLFPRHRCTNFKKDIFLFDLFQVSKNR